MALIREFLTAIDERWSPLGSEPISLQIIGSTALMLQTDYNRGTKDSDVLESSADPTIKDRLIAIAGKETELARQSRVYIDVVNRAILFLPQQPVFHPVPNFVLRNFRVEALDVVDVVLSKLKRYKPDDINDISAMADKGLLDHGTLVARFKAAADWFSLDARAPDVPRYLENLRSVERNILDVPPSEIELPPECMPE
ncbi:MAG: hypothetical protein HY927_16815 [Elusimicrobia bacterium]|nr:hypothetical protein [Elusimicrobiota bacterium]